MANVPKLQDLFDTPGKLNVYFLIRPFIFELEKLKLARIRRACMCDRLFETRDFIWHIFTGHYYNCLRPHLSNAIKVELCRLTMTEPIRCRCNKYWPPSSIIDFLSHSWTCLTGEKKLNTRFEKFINIFNDTPCGILINEQKEDWERIYRRTCCPLTRNPWTYHQEKINDLERLLDRIQAKICRLELTSLRDEEKLNDLIDADNFVRSKIDRMEFYADLIRIEFGNITFFNRWINTRVITAREAKDILRLATKYDSEIIEMMQKYKCIYIEYETKLRRDLNRFHDQTNDERLRYLNSKFDFFDVLEQTLLNDSKTYLEKVKKRRRIYALFEDSLRSGKKRTHSIDPKQLQEEIITWQLRLDNAERQLCEVTAKKDVILRQIEKINCPVRRYNSCT